MSLIQRGNNYMKVIDFINKLQELGYTNDTELAFGFINRAIEDYYECKIKSIDDENRKSGYDDIVVVFEKPEDYIKSEVNIENIDLREELLDVMDKHL